MLIQPMQPLFSNLVEQDGGVVTAGHPQSRPLDTRSEDMDPTDLYKPSASWEDVKQLMEKGVEEYNKVHPHIKLALYKVSTLYPERPRGWVFSHHYMH